MLPLIVGPALRELVKRRARHARVQRLGGAAVLRAGRGRRRLRPARRLPDRPARPPARADVEHPALRVLGLARRVQHEHLTAPVLPLHDVHRRVRRVRRGRGVARRAVPEPKQRERVLGYTQAFSSLGGLLVSAASTHICVHARGLPAGDSRRTRGLALHAACPACIPAIPLIVIRPFLPESPVWQQKKRGRHAEAPEPRRAVLARLFAARRSSRRSCSRARIGAAFGAIQHMPRIVPGLPEVRARWRRAAAATGRQRRAVVAGDRRARRPLVLAMLAVVIVSRRALLRLFQVPGPDCRAARVLFAPTLSADALPSRACSSPGLFTVAQFSFWGNYLPRMYPTHLRGTGESFAANVGGRMIGTSFVFVTTTLASHLRARPTCNSRQQPPSSLPWCISAAWR